MNFDASGAPASADRRDRKVSAMGILQRLKSSKTATSHPEAAVSEFISSFLVFSVAAIRNLRAVKQRSSGPTANRLDDVSRWGDGKGPHVPYRLDIEEF